MLSGTWPNSPAMLWRPRRTSPLTTTPTPRPSDTLTKTKSPRDGQVLAHRPQLRERARAARVLDLHGQAGRGGDRRADVAVLPAERRGVDHARGRAIDHARHDDADALAPHAWRVRGEQAIDDLREPPRERPRVAHGLERPRCRRCGRPIRSASRTYDSLTRRSTAITTRREALTCRKVGLRPRWVVEESVAPSTSRPSSMRRLTSSVTAPRATFIARARSAREMGWCARTRFSTICAVDRARGAARGHTNGRGIDAGHVTGREPTARVPAGDRAGNLFTDVTN